jgi:hypothetical protein
MKTSPPTLLSCLGCPFNTSKLHGPYSIYWTNRIHHCPLPKNGQLFLSRVDILIPTREVSIPSLKAFSSGARNINTSLRSTVSSTSSAHQLHLSIATRTTFNDEILCYFLLLRLDFALFRTRHRASGPVPSRRYTALWYAVVTPSRGP